MAMLIPTAPAINMRIITASPMPSIIGSAGWILTRPTEGTYQKKKPANSIIKVQKERRPINIPLAGLYGTLSSLPFHSASRSIKDLPCDNSIPLYKFRRCHFVFTFRLQFLNEQNTFACCHKNTFCRYIYHSSGFFPNH